jgi:cytoskeletal protein CcmA (bactofilin family)
MDWNRRFEQVFSSARVASHHAHTQIGAGAHIIGDVISAEAVELSGRITGRLVSGNVQKNGSVLIKAKGSLQGHVVGDSVTILGHVQGTVRSAGVLQLGADAQVAADLGYGDLYIQPGAVVKGVLSPVTSQTLPSTPNWAKA